MNYDGVLLSQGVQELHLNDESRDPFEMMYNPEPPAPNLQSKGIIAMDITEQFSHAAQQLDVGQLVKDPYFTLFEAVGALEIMDKKMDSGYLEPGESMEDDFDFSQPLLPEEIIGIMDQLLCHEMAWHMGHPLGQTIFSSVHIDRILSPCPLDIDQTYFDRSESCASDEPLTCNVLRAYCLGLIKTCFYVNNQVKSEHFYEEEDFVTHTFNRTLLDGFDHEIIIEFINQSRQLLKDARGIAEDLKQALDHRLSFRARLLTIVEGAGARTSGEPPFVDLWTSLLVSLPDLKSTKLLGKTVMAAFSEKIQRKLASTVPPRPIVEVSYESAYEHLERLCRDASIAIEVLKYYDSHCLMTFVSIFQARKPQPTVYVRTLLQHYLFGDMVVLGTMSIRQVLDDDLRASVMPAHILLDRENDDIEVTTDPRHNMATKMEIFRSRVAGSYLDILRTMCQNRCRIRRTLCHTIVDWDNLQLDAEDLDQELRQFTLEVPITDLEISDEPLYSFPLSSWAYFYKIRQMEWIVQTGFELDIYQPDELASMYWYLQYLSKTQARHLERIRGFVIRSFAIARRDPKLSTEKRAEYANALSFINYSNMKAAATYGLADALSCLFVVLTRHNLLHTPPRPYSNDKQRYEVRMKPFLSIGLPELIPFPDLTQLVTQSDETSLDLLNFAVDSAMAAKKGFEVLSKLSAKDAFCQGSHESWLKDIKDCLKACIFTGLSIAAVKKAISAAGRYGEPKIKVEIPGTGMGYHVWWTVPKIVPVL